MKNRRISEHAARTGILALFAVGAFFGLFFLVSTLAMRAKGEVLTGTELMQRQQQELAADLQTAMQIDDLEQQLAAARQENAGLAQEYGALEEEKDRLETAQVSIMDAMTLNYQGEFYCTAYCCEAYPHICGGNGVTASGTVPTPGLTVAADWNVFPPGTWLYIEDVGLRRVEDSGSAIKQKRLDIAIDTHDNALRWGGLGNHHVWVLDFDALAA